MLSYAVGFLSLKVHLSQNRRKVRLFRALQTVGFSHPTKTNPAPPLHQHQARHQEDNCDQDSFALEG